MGSCSEALPQQASVRGKPWRAVLRGCLGSMHAWVHHLSDNEKTGMFRVASDSRVGWQLRRLLYNTQHCSCTHYSACTWGKGWSLNCSDGITTLASVPQEAFLESLENQVSSAQGVERWCSRVFVKSYTCNCCSRIHLTAYC